MPDLRITDTSGTTKTTLPISTYKIKREGFNVLTQAEIAVDRTAFNSSSGLKPGEDRAYIEMAANTLFGGVYRSAERQGSQVKLKIRGFGQRMDDALPTETGQHKIAADDSALIREAVGQAPDLSEGVIETVEAGQTWVFSGASPWKKAKTVANAAGGELKITPDRRVHYLETRGQDKTDTTLSPFNASFVEDTFVVSRDGVTGNTTHLLVTGVGEGTAQVECAVVPRDDTTNYDQFDRIETYENPNYSDGDPARWTTRSNKDLKNEDAAASWGKKLIAEMNEEEIRVETTVKSDYVELGDTFHVQHDKEGVDQDLRAVQVTEVYTPQGGRRFETVFSNFDVAHHDQAIENHKDAERYGGSAYEGDLTNIQQGPGRGPVDSGHDYVLSVFYPKDVLYEVDAQLNIKGLNYRAYSQGSADNGDMNQTAFDNVQSGTATISANSWNTVDDFIPSSPTSELRIFVEFSPSVSTEGNIEPHIRLHNASKGNYHPDSSGHPVYSYWHDDYRVMGRFWTTDPSNTDGDTMALQFYNNKGSDYDIDFRTLWMGIGRHNHPPSPGILDWDGSDQSPAHYPGNVDVVINGTSLGHSIGDGTRPFSRTVDVRGQLEPGWNEIRLTSSDLGHLDATFSADLFRQSL